MQSLIFFFTPEVKCLLLLAIVAVLFVTEIIPLAVTAVLASLACWLLGLIELNQVFVGFSDPTVILFGGMFVIGAAMFYTGLAQAIGTRIVRLCGSGENSLMFGVMLIAATMSAFLSNTGTTACLIPVLVAICHKAKLSASRQLMPMAFASGLGGTITLIGTPPNILANVALKAAGMEELQFGFFEYAYIGIPVTIAGILYMMLIGKRLLPDTPTEAAQVDVEQEIEATQTTKSKQWICGLIMGGVVFCMATELLPLEIAAAIGAILCILFGLLSEKQAYQSVDWITIFLFAGMIPVTFAMNNSGAAKLIANFAIGLMGKNPSPYLVTTVLFVLAVVLTQFMSNTASKALLCPVGLAIATQMGASPRAVLMAILIASSSAYASPVGTPPNTLVLGPGHYRFMDYVKCGTGLIVVSMLASIVLIPLIWPFF